MIDLYHRKNEVSIDLAGDYALGIEITYSGIMYAEVEIPNGWIFSANNEKIFLFKISI